MILKVHKGSYKIILNNGSEKEVKGYTCREWGIHKDCHGEWVITHIPSGLKLCTFFVGTFRPAKAFISRLASVSFPCKWGIEDCLGNIPKLREIYRAVCMDYGYATLTYDGFLTGKE